MPKRARFEVIPPRVLAANSSATWDDRTRRRVARLRNYLLGGFDGIPEGLRRDARHMELIRSFGLYNDLERSVFATVTGRLGLIQHAIRTAIDRRRRQAYLLLRRVLPIELASLTLA